MTARTPPRRHLFFLARSLLACGLLALALGACGDDETPAHDSRAGTNSPAWSEPAGTSAAGSPDQDAGALRTAEALMGELLRRVEQGRGPSSDPTFGRDVDAVAAVLWEPDAVGAERAAAQVHVQLANLAGDVASLLAGRPPGEPDATERKIHSAWTAALARPPDAYRAWCAQEGAALLKEREEAVRRLLEEK